VLLSTSFCLLSLAGRARGPSNFRRVVLSLHLLRTSPKAEHIDVKVGRLRSRGVGFQAGALVRSLTRLGTLPESGRHPSTMTADLLENGR
jgi:hypothetical protein